MHSSNGHHSQTQYNGMVQPRVTGLKTSPQLSCWKYFAIFHGRDGIVAGKNVLLSVKGAFPA